MGDVKPAGARARQSRIPRGHIARVFPVHGIKDAEDANKETHNWRVRAVFGGNHIRTTTGLTAVFQEIHSTPLTMEAARVLIFLALYFGFIILQADCVKAYLQALMTGVPTFVKLPRAWWPADWHKRFKEPVVRLKRALYGHPLAGEIWHEHIETAIRKLGYKSMLEWPSMYYR